MQALLKLICYISLVEQILTIILNYEFILNYEINTLKQVLCCKSFHNESMISLNVYLPVVRCFLDWNDIFYEHRAMVNNLIIV